MKLPDRIQFNTLGKFISDHFFLLLLLAAVAINYFVEMRGNRAFRQQALEQQSFQDIRAVGTELLLVNKALDDHLRYTIKYMHGGGYQFLYQVGKQEEQIDRSLTLLPVKLKNWLPDSLLQQWLKDVELVLNQQKSIIETYNTKGSAAAISVADQINKSILRDQVSGKAYLMFSRLNIKLQKLYDQQQQKRLDAIAVDYAMPQVVSFIFLMIACFILFKTQQVRGLNRKLRKAMAMEQLAQQAKDRFIANITHELKSPLNAVLGFATRLSRTNLSADQQLSVQSIRHSGEHLLHVINEVLDLSKIKEGRMNLSAEPFSLRDQLSALDEMIRTRAEEKGLSYQVNIEESLPDRLKGDGSKLLQVLLNLVSNAIKFTEIGGVKVTVSGQLQQNKKIQIFMIVEDTGVGMASDQLAYIFDRFYQVSGDQQKNKQGTGLGLSITREIVEMQGGKISVESIPGKGSIFQVILPYEIIEFETKQVSQISEYKNYLPSHMHILVVDDNRLNLDLAQWMIESSGARVSLVMSGSEALKFLRTEKVDVVLMDIHMPQMDGKETTRRIREELHLEIPVIALSAYSDPLEKQQCLQSGMDAYLHKPVREKELMEMLQMFAHIDQAIAKSQVRDPNFSPIGHSYNNDMLKKIATALPIEINKLKQALDHEDEVTIRALAHDLKTTFAMAGDSDKIAACFRFFESWNADAMHRMASSNMLDQLMKACNDAVERIMLQIIPHEPKQKILTS